MINHVFHYVFVLIWGNCIYIEKFQKTVYIYSALWTEAARFCDISTMTYQTKRCHKAVNSNITVACIRCCQFSKQFRRSCSVRLLRFPAVLVFTFSTDTKLDSPDHWLDLWEEAEVAGSEVWRVGWVLKYSDVLLANNCLTDNASWAGALSWCKIHPFLHNSSRFLLARSRYFVKASM